MSDTPHSEPDVIPSQAPASPGAILRHARESQGLSCSEVGTALNLRAAVIESLEMDTYDEVPVAAYRRGYLRSYAQLLGVDVKQVMDLYQARMGNEEIERKVTPVYIAKPPSRLGAWLFRLMTLVVIAGVVGLTLMWWQSRGGSEPPTVGDNGPVSVDSIDGSRTETSPEPDEAQPQPTPETDSAAAVAEEAAETETAEPQTSAIVAATEAAAEQEAEAQAAAPDANAEEEANATSAQEAGSDASANTLQLSFNEQSWTEIYDGTNTRVLSGLQGAGTKATVEGEPPFRLVIGNASGVELNYRGETVDLRQRAGASNVARFTLGE
ncbi:RodZ domain-containing protein [Halomonas binhaiensis]|uniref:DUF4115 domain-containing protein n=1 Tax=Halomonas binhaiensis TaxID=2562282 RepID=A0A5C1NIP0_9GAMM|nr:RodZ domain-containing protein [Halomonas binhaiensis]QEM83196.1 DUF4115 domain-containing protein [Halomonas binhaiensis]